MDGFSRQLNNNMRNDIHEFNNNAEYDEIRKLYKNNFDEILFYIKRSNPKLAVEDIALLDSNLTKKIMAKMSVLKEINNAIAKQELSLNGIK